MIVFNPVEFDSRVQRSIKALEVSNDIHLFCPRLNNKYKSKYSESCVYHSIIKWNSIKTIIFLPIFLLESLLLFSKKSYDCVYIHDYYPLALTFIFKFIFKKNVIYDMHEIIISEDNNSKSNNLFQFIESKCIQYIDFVITPSAQRSEFIKTYYNLSNLPHAFQNITIPEKNVEITRSHKILNTIDNNLLKIIYIGDMSITRGLDDIISGFELLDNSYSLHLVGNGPDFNILRKRIKNVQNAHIHTAIHSSNIYSLLKYFDIGIVTYSMKGLNNKLCAPNKIFDYAYCNIPVVTSGQEPLVHFINSYKIGRYINENNNTRSVEFKNAIIDVAMNLKLYSSNLKKFIFDFSYKDEFSKLNHELSIYRNNENFN